MVHHEELRCYLRNGMVLRKIHEGILYEEQDFMKKFIEINAEARKIARNDFEKDFYKLMSNSVFGKTMENVRDRAKVEIVNGLSKDVRLRKLVSRPHFRDVFVFEGSKLVSLRMGESMVTLNKPISMGQCVLDNAKGDMSEWHYRYMKPKYGKRASLCYMDTDSFVYEIRTENFYEDIREDVPRLLDTSAYPEDHPAGLPRVNKKVPGLMKDEACGRTVNEVICLSLKMYSYKMNEYSDMCGKGFCDGRCGKKDVWGVVGRSARA